MVRQGATVVDIGGESTRPGAEVVDVQIEIDRVVSVIRFVPEKLALV
jgi:dihydropteroate synthase